MVYPEGLSCRVFEHPNLRWWAFYLCRFLSHLFCVKKVGLKVFYYLKTRRRKLTALTPPAPSPI